MHCWARRGPRFGWRVSRVSIGFSMARTLTPCAHSESSHHTRDTHLPVCAPTQTHPTLPDSFSRCTSTLLPPRGKKSSIFKVCSPSQGKGKAETPSAPTHSLSWRWAPLMQRTPEPSLETEQPEPNPGSINRTTWSTCSELGSETGNWRSWGKEWDKRQASQTVSEPVVNKGERERGGIIPSLVVKANDAARQESRGSHSRSWF